MWGPLLSCGTAVCLKKLFFNYKVNFTEILHVFISCYPRFSEGQENPTRIESHFQISISAYYLPTRVDPHVRLNPFNYFEAIIYSAALICTVYTEFQPVEAVTGNL